jgi:cellulose synthase/poly-beta-1,6-N-acetylglucosamine synthase-like glycosyltransferase
LKQASWPIAFVVPPRRLNDTNVAVNDNRRNGRRHSHDSNTYRMLPVILNVILCVLALLLSVPISVFALEIMAAVSWRRINFFAPTSRQPVAIIIPAHNEEGGIAATLRSIVPQLRKEDRLLVIADNCSDATRDVAASEGAEVISRSNPEHRGKGFALDFGLQHLKSNPVPIVIIIDADCYVEPQAIDILSRVCAESKRPAQAQYLMRNEGDCGVKMQISEFAWIVKNLARPEGLGKLGLPCQLMGSGMAFPWESIRALDLASANLVEDMKMGIDLAILGAPPIFVPGAVVLSQFPTDEHGIRNQRTRWEHGHLVTILREAPRLFIHGLKRMDPMILFMALDLSVPPLSLLLLETCTLLMLAAVFFALTGYLAPLIISSTATSVLFVAMFAAWMRYGRRVIPVARLLAATTYLLWKIPIYVRFIFSRQNEWIRSKRNEDR